MDGRRLSKLARGYSFMLSNIIGGKIVNLALDALASMDYRMLVPLSMWHPDHDTRIKYLRKRRVQVGEHVFVDQGEWIEITTPQYVVLEDYTAVAYGAVIVAYDATVSRTLDAPLRVRETRLKYGAGVGMNCIVMPGVTFEKYAHSMAGAVVTKDVPERMIVAGNPAEVKCSVDDIAMNWQADIPRHPQDYFDDANPWRIPSVPWQHLLTWREDGVEVQPASKLRTGTPFDYILDAKEQKEKER